MLKPSAAILFLAAAAFGASRVDRYALLLDDLSEPRSYREMLAADVGRQHWWLGTERRLLPLPVVDSDMEQWLGESYVTRLLSICKGSIDAFYEQVATLQSKDEAHYFAEKLLPGTFGQQKLSEIYPGALEVFLVRDFRDMVCSMFAWDQKLGTKAFDHANPTTYEDYMRWVKPEIDPLIESWKETSSSSSLLLRYEDLLLEPCRTLTSLFSALRLDASDAIVDQTLGDASRLLPHEQRSHRTTATPEQSIGRWKRELDTEMQGVSKEVLGEALATFGYL